jgi:beta-N-acetylhexosaminidase
MNAARQPRGAAVSSSAATQPQAEGQRRPPAVHSPVILDIAGTTLEADDRRRLAHPLTGGVIFFARNWQDRRQLTELAAEIKSLRADALLCVDHEGGRVQRFRSDGFTQLPPMRVLGEMWMQDGAGGRGSGAMRALEAATAAGHVLGSELRACGVDLSFTPVLDLDHGSSGVIGDRAFHRDPRVVSLLAKSLMHGLLEAGMRNCGKHFPGHGHVRADSHTATPEDDRSLAAILGDDARPYEWLAGSLASVMPAHVIYSQVDDNPAGFSSRWLNDILRHQLGFDGAIFSDDLSMAGARRVGGIEVTYAEAAGLALAAGCDMVLLCNQSLDGGAAVDALLDGLLEAAAHERWQPDAESESRRLDLLPQMTPIAWDELMHSPRYQRSLERLP